MGTETKQRWTKKRALAGEPQWSEYQNAVFNWVSDRPVGGNSCLQIGAKAGSGKTSTLSAIVARLPNDAKVCILAFNKHIVETMQAKVPTRVKVATAHGYGFGLLSQYWAGSPDVEDNKYRKLVRETVLSSIDVSELARLHLISLMASKPDAELEKLKKQARTAAVREMANFGLRLVEGCQSTLIDGSGDALAELIDYFGLEVPVGGDRLIPWIKSILQQGEEIARQTKTISFGDMLWLPHLWALQPAKKDWVLIDEAQDATMAQLSLYRKLSDGANTIFVGDADQSIQGFAFSSPTMWSEIRRQFNAEQLPLSVSYRCPSSHLELARLLVPDIQAAPNAKVGEIATIHPERIKDNIQKGDLVLCRFNAPLVNLCIALILKGIPAQVRGRDFAAQIVALAEEVAPQDWSEFIPVLRKSVGDRIEKLRNQSKEEQADSLADRWLCVKAIYEEFGSDCASLTQFTKKVDGLFTDKETVITLSSIHRSKGDEANRVFILGCNSLPYQPKEAKPWQYEQERNLAYVALTRSKDALFFAPIGKDGAHTEMLTKRPYGGMAIAPTKFVEPASNPTEGTERSLPPKFVPTFTIGMWVAIYKNPNIKARIVSIADDVLMVQEGDRIYPVSIDRVAPLIPQVAAGEAIAL